MTPNTKRNPTTPNKWLVFLLVSAGVFFSTMDSSMVNISLPYIMEDFGTSLAQTGWVVLIYLLTTSVTMLFWGHLSTRFGRENIYTVGLFTFGLGSLLCSQATSLNTLIIYRFIQALGAAMFMANGPAMIKAAFGTKKLGRSLGLIGISTACGLMAGPAVGGFVIEYQSWQTLFLLPVPVCFLAGFISLKGITKTRPPQQKHAFDWIGSFWWFMLLATSTFFLSHATEKNAEIKIIAGGMAIAIISLIFFIKQESHLSLHKTPTSPAPLIPTNLFIKKSVLISTTTVTLVFLCLFSVLILTPFYLNKVLHLPSSTIGMVMLAIPITALITAPIAGFLADKIDAKLITTSGLTLCTLGLFLFTTLTPHTTPLTVAMRLACFGIGLALFLSPNSTIALRQTANEHTGTVSALLATGRTLGMLLGISLASLTFSLLFSHFTGGLDMKDYTDEHAMAFIKSLQFSYYCFLGVGVLGVVLATMAPAEQQTS